MIRGTTKVGAEPWDTEGPSCHTVTTATSPSPGAVRPHACCCGELPAQTHMLGACWRSPWWCSPPPDSEQYLSSALESTGRSFHLHILHKASCLVCRGVLLHAVRGFASKWKQNEVLTCSTWVKPYFEALLVSWDWMKQSWHYWSAMLLLGTWGRFGHTQSTPPF